MGTILKSAYASNLLLAVVVLLLATMFILGDLSADSVNVASTNDPAFNGMITDHGPSSDDVNANRDESFGMDVEVKDSYTVSLATLSEETKRLLEAVSRGSVYVFDVEGIEDSVISVWLEQFEKGEKLPNLFGPTSSRFFETEDKVQVIFDYHYQSNYNDDEDQEVLSLTTAIMIDGSMSKGYTEIPLTKTEMKSWSSLNEKREVPRNQPVSVMMILEKNASQMSVLTHWPEQYDLTGTLPEELAEFDRVIFFRIMIEDSGASAKW